MEEKQSYQSWSLLNRGRWRIGRNKVLYLELRFGTVTMLSKEDQQAIVWSKVRVLKGTGKLSSEDLQATSSDRASVKNQYIFSLRD